MIPRYTPVEIAAIFSDESRLQRWLDIELLASEGWAEIGRIPKDVLPALRTARIDVDRINELEAEQGHDVAAFISAVQETIGDEGRFIHLGLTSSDIVDTALATQLRDAAAIIDADAAELETALRTQAERHRTTLMMGRTHGVHAEPLTLGVKLANHYDEVRRSRERLRAATAEVAVGQISGAVGTHASVSPKVEEHVCKGLGLTVAPAATQVLARDRHASFVSAMAILGAVLERLATTIRLLQITEVDEAEEPFSERQKGSSAMPHKRNPILCERICGIARVLRGHAMTALDDVALWHERDISHSSAERVILPDACALTAYALRLSTRVVSGLRVKPENMSAHVNAFGGVVFSQRILGALIVEAGWPRERAYRTVQALARRARDGEGGFRDLVVADPAVSAALGEHLSNAFDPQAFLRQIDDTYTRLGLSTQQSTTPAIEAALSELAVEAGVGGGQL
ncbi:MAG: adenylosuccinate lyase [Candidatus Dormibacteraeota bacterium]|uniref:Adenylosuccinate lyase n=1 Tax=Candidatus Amunia macphersoniae TaxID=3127014 RepID=A0A934KKQ5_9BACT|nr:adenylosuccinate lyase [Candidatus Dormibacteraeota bacterium]